MAHRQSGKDARRTMGTVGKMPDRYGRLDMSQKRFEAGNLDAIVRRYQPGTLKDGFNRLPDGEEIFYISNPALGLWALRTQFEPAA